MKITKKLIKNTLRSESITNIFNLAKKCGININDRSELCQWIKENAPSQRISRLSYDLSYGAGSDKNRRVNNYYKNRLVISEAINFGKEQKSDGRINSNYKKILIQGNNNIYWAHPFYQHSDYNKSIAFPNTEKYRKVSDLINKFLVNN